MLPPEKQPSVFLGSDGWVILSFRGGLHAQCFIWNLIVFSSFGHLSFTLVPVNFVFVLHFVECSSATDLILCMYRISPQLRFYCRLTDSSSPSSSAVLGSRQCLCFGFTWLKEPINPVLQMEFKYKKKGFWVHWIFKTSSQKNVIFVLMTIWFPPKTNPYSHLLSGGLAWSLLDRIPQLSASFSGPCGNIITSQMCVSV